MPSPVPLGAETHQLTTERHEACALAWFRGVGLNPTRRPSACCLERGLANGLPQAYAMSRLTRRARMGIKKRLIDAGMKFMSDPRVMKLMQDERFVGAMMTALSVPGRLGTLAQDQAGRLARMMDLATEREIRDLRRTVRSLEDQLAELKRQRGDGAS